MLVRRHLHFNAAICAGLAPGMILHLHVWSTTSASMRCLSEDVQCPAAPAYVQGVLICVVHSTALCQSGAIVPQAAHKGRMRKPLAFSLHKSDKLWPEGSPCQAPSSICLQALVGPCAADKLLHPRDLTNIQLDCIPGHER